MRMTVSALQASLCVKLPHKLAEEHSEDLAVVVGLDQAEVEAAIGIYSADHADPRLQLQLCHRVP